MLSYSGKQKYVGKLYSKVITNPNIGQNHDNHANE